MPLVLSSNSTPSHISALKTNIYYDYVQNITKTSPPFAKDDMQH